MINIQGHTSAECQTVYSGLKPGPVHHQAQYLTVGLLVCFSPCQLSPHPAVPCLDPGDPKSHVFLKSTFHAEETSGTHHLIWWTEGLSVCYLLDCVIQKIKWESLGRTLHSFQKKFLLQMPVTLKQWSTGEDRKVHEWGHRSQGKSLQHHISLNHQVVLNPGNKRGLPGAMERMLTSPNAPAHLAGESETEQ